MTVDCNEQEIGWVSLSAIIATIATLLTIFQVLGIIDLLKSLSSALNGQISLPLAIALILLSATCGCSLGNSVKTR